MNLNYYLRGLGTGIVVTALIMGIAAGRKEPMSNAEIKERARALGMVEEESTHLIDLEEPDNAQPKASKEPEPEVAQKDAELKENDSADDVQGMVASPEAEMDNEAEGDLVDEAEGMADAKDDMSTKDDISKEKDMPNENIQTGDQEELEGQEEETTDPADQKEDDRIGNEGITLTIARGDGSHTVCKKLEEAGLIESASEYDLFLYQNGYDKKIRAGTVEIPAGAGQEEIARIICGIE